MIQRLIPLLLIGCEPVPAMITGSDDLQTDTDTDTDADADSDADSDADADPTVWDGSRQFTFFFGSVCNDGVNEEGIEITENAAYPQATACSVCDQIFEVEVTPGAICSGTVKILTPTYRGIQWHRDKAMIYTITEDDSGNWHAKELGGAKIQGDDLIYYYDGWYDDWAYYEVDGKVAIP